MKMLTMSVVSTVLTAGSAFGLEAATGSISCDGVADRDVIPLERAQPAYPMEAAMFCIEGFARYRFTIENDGRVTDATIVDSDPEGVFDGTERIFDFWRFQPRCVDGEAVSRTATQQIDFRLPPIGPSPCKDGLPSSAAALQIELVALMQQVHQALNAGQVIRIDPEPVLDPPYDRIEGAYRRFFLTQARFQERQVLAWVRDLMDHHLGRAGLDPGLDLGRHRNRLNTLETLFDEIATEWSLLSEEHRVELAAAGQSEELDPRVRRVFVDPMIEGPPMGFDLRRNMAPMLGALEAERAIVAWMVRHRHEWEFTGTGLRFASDQLSNEYRALVDEREAAVNALHLEATRQSMMWSVE